MLVCIRQGIICEEIAGLIIQQHNKNVTLHYFNHIISYCDITHYQADKIYLMNTYMHDIPDDHAAIVHQFANSEEALQYFNLTWQCFDNHSVDESSAYYAISVIKTYPLADRTTAIKYALKSYDILYHINKGKSWVEKAQSMVNIAVEHSVYVNNYAVVSLGSMCEIMRTHVSLHNKYINCTSLVHYYRVINNHFVNKVSIRGRIADKDMINRLMSRLCGSNFGGTTTNLYGVNDNEYYQADGTSHVSFSDMLALI